MKTIIELKRGDSIDFKREVFDTTIFIGSVYNITIDNTMFVEMHEYGENLKYATSNDTIIFYDTYEIKRAGGENKWNLLS